MYRTLFIPLPFLVLPDSRELCFRIPTADLKSVARTSLRLKRSGLDCHSNTQSHACFKIQNRRIDTFTAINVCRSAGRRRALQDN